MMVSNEEIVKNLAGIWYFATCEGDQPHLRAFDNAALVDGKIYCGTSKNKKVFKQIVENPKVEVYVLTDFGPFRFKAKAFPELDEGIIEQAFSEMNKNRDENSVVVRFDEIEIVQ